jgi:DHA2 family multidrug resistance protein
MFVAGRQGPAEIPDRHRGGGDCAVDVCGDQCLRRSRLFVFGFCYMARGRMLFGVGFPLIFVSITSASYEVSGPTKPLGLRPDLKRAVVLRAVPSDLARDRTLPSSVQYQGTLHPKTRYFVWQGSPLVEARQQTIAWSSSRCGVAAGVIPGLYAFWVLTPVVPASGALGRGLHKVKLRRGAPASH